MTQAQIQTATNLVPERILALFTNPKSRDLRIKTNTATYTIAPNGDVTLIVEHLK